MICFLTLIRNYIYETVLLTDVNVHKRFLPSLIRIINKMNTLFIVYEYNVDCYIHIARKDYDAIISYG